MFHAIRSELQSNRFESVFRSFGDFRFDFRGGLYRILLGCTEFIWRLEGVCFFFVGVSVDFLIGPRRRPMAVARF